MRQIRYQRVILIAVGLWFAVLLQSSSAQDVRVSARSKALAHYILAVSEELNGNDQKAVAQYEAALRLDPKQVLPRLRLAAQYTHSGRLVSAVSQLKAALKLDPKLPQAHYLLAVIYTSQDKVDLAVEQFEKALSVSPADDPQDADVHLYLSKFYFMLGQADKAMPHLKQVLRFQPKNVPMLYIQGSLYLELKDREQAKRSFRQVIALEPQHDGALNSLAYMYAEEGIKLDDAKRMILKAIDLDPSNGAYHDTLGWVLFKQGLYQESLIVLEKALSYINDPTILDHIGDVHLAMGDPLKARLYWRRSLTLNPKQDDLARKLEEHNKRSASRRIKNPSPAK